MSRTSVRSEQVRDQNILVDDLRDFAVITNSGLNVDIKAGRIRNDNVITDKIVQTLAMSDNTTNYVELNTAGVASSNTTGFTTGRVPLAIVVTSSGAVTTITDKRSWVIVDNNSGGAGTPPGTLSATTKDLWIALARTKIVEDQTANRSANEVWSLRTDVFTDGSGIDSGLSVDYVLRGTPNYDIVVTTGSLELFRPNGIPTNLQGYWKLNNTPEIECLDVPTNENVSTDYTQGYGQTFTTIGAVSIQYVKCTMSKLGSPAGTARMSIYATSGGVPTGSPLASSATFNCTDIKSTETFSSSDYELFSLASPLSLSATTVYAFVIEPVSGSWSHDGSNRLRFFRNASGTYSGGVTVGNNGSWAIISGQDMGFQVFSSSNPPMEIDSSVNTNLLKDNHTIARVAQDYWRTGENSADFEASNLEYLSITDGLQTGLDITGSISFSAFVKIESAGGADKPVLTKWDETLGSQKSYDFGVSISDKVYFNGSSNGSSEVNAVGLTTLSVGKWHHIACVYNGTFIILYLDGNVDSVTAYSSGLFSSTSPFWIGRQHRSVSAYMDGLIKDGAVWSSALTPLQIKSIALGVDLTSFAYRPSNIATPVSYWKLNEISSGAGAVTRNDSVGSNHLTDNNTVTVLGGYIEGASADFERSNSEYLSITDGAQSGLDITGAITISAWIKLETLPSVAGDTFNIVAKFNPTTNQRSYILAINTSNQLIFAVSNDGTVGTSAQVTGTTALQSGVWYHVVGKYNGSSAISVYLDGTSNATPVSFSGSIFNSTAPVEIGANTVNVTVVQFFDGLINDVAIWSSSLSDANIASLASGLPLQSEGIISHWKMNESSGNRADSIGSNTLTDNGSVPGVTGLVGNASDFNGSSQYLTDASAGDFACPTDEEWTWFTWHNFDTHSAEMYFLNLPDSVNNLSISKQTTGGGRWDLAIGGATFSTTIATTTGAWEHLLITKRGTTWELHVGGYRRNTQAQSGAITASGTLTIARTGAGSLYFDGKLDEMGLAKRGFREEEVKTIYNKGKNGKEILSTELAPATSAVVISTAFTVSEVPDRALMINNKVTGTGSLTFYVSRVSSPGTNLADTTKWTPITENTITDISGQSSGTSCRWAVEIDGDSELDDIAVVFGLVGGSGGGGGGASTSERHFSTGLMGG